MKIIYLKGIKAWLIKDQETGKNLAGGIDLKEVILDALRVKNICNK